MITSSHSLLSSLSSSLQPLVIQLIQQELQPLLQIPLTATDAHWTQAILSADPVLCCHYTNQFIIKICPESRPQLLLRIQQALSDPS